MTSMNTEVLIGIRDLKVDFRLDRTTVTHAVAAEAAPGERP